MLLTKTNFNFSVTFILSSGNPLNLDQSKILSFGKELMHLHDALDQARYQLIMVTHPQNRS